MSFYSDDPIRDYDRYDAQREKQLEDFPRCSECDKYICDDFYYEFDGEIICEDCLCDNHRKSTDSFID
jgi:formylmethanofuran dehydrogenase subunit E